MGYQWLIVYNLKTPSPEQYPNAGEHESLIRTILQGYPGVPFGPGRICWRYGTGVAVSAHSGFHP
jgi:hypothetical protein